MIPEREQGVSELIGTILVIILVIAIAGIIAALVFGWSIPLQRTPYFVSEATPIENASVVKLFHAQGDPVSLYPGATQGLPMKMTLASRAVTYDVTPLPTAAGKGWRAGETLYIFRNSSGVWIADSPALILNSTRFAPGPWRLSLIDITSNVLIVQHTLDLAGDGDGPVPLPPVAEFTANVTTGTAPLVVQFTDLSTNGPASWNWNFGDSGTSIVQDPLNLYTQPGTFTVTLTVANPYGSDSEVKNGYIVVSAPLQPDGSISGYKWNDLNGNGIWEAGEPGLSGWTIRIHSRTGSNIGSLIATTTTDATGHYMFTGLQFTPSNLQYAVSEAVQSGWTLSYPDNPYNPAIGYYHAVVLSNDNRYEGGKNFGNHQN
jgi:PKD repeat protein